tara:strand:+ start:244 stop:438 length:195 start_codon:yes stop_codon:yes gene_type:complete
MNIQNMNLFNGNREQAINIAKIIKDKCDQSRKHIRDYSGLKACFANDLYVDDGVVKTNKVHDED